MRWWLLALLSACSGTAAPRPSAPPPPPSGAMLLGHPVWDGALADATAQRLLARVHAALDDHPPALRANDDDWSAPLMPWLSGSADAMTDIQNDADAVAAHHKPPYELLATIALAVAGDDLVSDLMSLHVPAEIATGKHGAETEQAFHEAFDELESRFAKDASEDFLNCAQLARMAPPPLRVWVPYCRDRADKLAALANRPRPAPKPPTAEEVFVDCDAPPESFPVTPDAPAPDPSAKAVVAYLYEEQQLKGNDAVRLEAAVAAQLRRSVPMPALDAKEIAAARALVGQRRLDAAGPACGVAPPLPAVLQRAHKHVVVGHISTTCFPLDAKREACGVLVTFSRAGDRDAKDLPAQLFGKVSRRDAPASEWIAAARRLGKDVGPGEEGGVEGGLSDGKTFAISGYSDEDPWLDVAWTLRNDTANRFGGCIDAAGSFNVSFALTSAGEAQQVNVAPMWKPRDGGKDAECIQHAIEQTSWRCTADGNPAKVAVRLCVAPR